MKLWVKICLIILLSAFMFSGGYVIASKSVKRDKEVVKETVTVTKDRFDGLTPAHVTGIGDSMCPTMCNDQGRKYPMYRVEPQEGDIISIDSPKFYSGGAIKRLIKIRDDGAWWVLGDNRENSHDSGDFGWILPSERSNVWVVRP